jgi:hypothetical protein
MAGPRLSARTWTSALLRRVAAAGDFGVVLRRGDDVSGAVILVHRGRGGAESAYQRALGPDGEYVWRVAATGKMLSAWVEKQVGFDPDLWVIELDTPDLARFIDEPIA